MDARTVIEAVRDRRPVPDGGIAWFAAGLADGSVTDAQAGAFAMAVCLNGLGEAGRVALTAAMRDSGDVLAWRDAPVPVVDKHSTGGIGDSISLILAPALAACGVWVPMISGRGLGHTGGTLDKLEAIRGYTVAVDEARLRAVVADVGCAIVGATGRIAPADRRLYAIRDVTGTVESVDLITASILSKKLAAGLQALVLDVKVGSGAFLPSRDAARALAAAMVDAANGAGCRTAALITDMDRPLAGCAGNALEVAECMGVLTGSAPQARLHDLTVALGAEVLALAGIDGGRERVAAAIASGAAAERFGRMVAALGGPSDFVDRWPAHLAPAPVVVDVLPDVGGTVARIDTRAVGLAVVALGGGRRREGDAVDPRVGFSHLAEPGQAVGPGAPLARVHAADEGAAAAAAAALRAAYALGDPPPPDLLVQERIG